MTALFGTCNTMELRPPGSSGCRRGGGDIWGGRLRDSPRGGCRLPSGCPSAAHPAASRLPSDSTDGVKMAAGFPTCVGAPSPYTSRSGWGSVPAATRLFCRHVPSRTSPCGHLPSSGKTRGRSARRSRRREAAIAPRLRPWRPAAVRRGLPAGQVLRTWEGLVDQGKSSGLEMIRKYPVTWGVLK